jgi:peptidoglycan hydrolase-like protein with peptidoglycan-binding domain
MGTTRTAGRRCEWLLAALVTVAVLAAGCGSDGNSAAKLAQAKVTVKQRAVTEAQAALTAKVKEFCSAGATYITAVDRYGDVLNQTAVTVGDVTQAGKDLEQPQSDAISAAEEATAAQQELATAQRELAEAKAALAAAQPSSSGSAPAPSASPTPTANATATGPSETATRVQQAEAEFATAQSGITSATPLRQAGQQFNAAAVALEMAWLQLFAEVGCLSDEQAEKTQAAVHDYTANLQQALTDAGYYTGKVDGVYGPSTLEAVQKLQKAHSLPATGWVDKATEAALQSDLAAKGGAATQAAVASTAAVQQTLKLAGFWDGPVDGQWTPALTEALKKFQTKLGVPATGEVDAATIAAVEKAVAPKPPTGSSPTSSATPTP